MAGFGIFGRIARRCGPWAYLLAGLGPGILPAAAPSITWPAALYNPQPQAGDIVLPLPCGGAMAFRALPTPGRDAGYPVVGPFAGADGTPYLLLGKYEVSALQAQALAAEATGQACPPPQAALQVPALTHWWEAVELGDRASLWLANQAEDIPACDPGATPCLPRVDAVAAYVRLPTAAEWEYAARGGLSVPAAAFTVPRYPMPDGLPAHAWFAANSRGVLQPLGGLAASPLGLHDLYGNAAEWALEAGLAPLGAPPPFTAQALGGHTGSPEADLRADRRWLYPPFATDPAARAGLRLLASVPLFTSPEKVREGERRRQAAPIPAPAPAAVAPAPPTAPAPPPPPPVKFYGHLRVTADAPGEVLVDGRVVGRVAPGQPFAGQTIAVGERRVAVRAGGYQAPEQTHGFRTRQWVEADFRLTAVPEMIALPGGEFWMGSPDGEADRDPDEGPRHRVQIAPFAMGKTAVTFAQYDAFAQATGRAKPQDEGWGRGDRPVINVSWEDAVAYAAWLAQATGEKYRLPSEAEWEYAARAGTATPFWTGKCINTDQANYVGNHDYAGCGAKTGVYRQQTVPVGSLPANPWGLHEVHGNVWEWVQDQYHESYKGAPADGSVWAAGGSSARVVRGASWDNRPRNLRAAKRNRFEPDIRSNLLGFRLAKTLPATPAQPSGSTATAQDQAQSGPTPATAGRSGQAQGAGEPVAGAQPAAVSVSGIRTPTLLVPKQRFEPEMIALPGGEFWMGSPDDEPDREKDEGPRHPVRIAPFAMGKTEVTFAQYDAFCQATGRAKPEDKGRGRGDRPVINVTWEDAAAYAAWLSQETGEAYRLPSEAEWEYAARAGTATPFWTGQCLTTDQANYDGNYDYNHCGAKTGVYRKKTVPVGSLPANPWGLHEMHGNVREWVADSYHDSYSGAPPDGSVWAAGGRSARVVRGGSWDDLPRLLRAAFRYGFEPVNRYVYLGFRLAKTLPASPAQPSGSTATAQDQAQSGPTPATAGRSGQGPGTGKPVAGAQPAAVSAGTLLTPTAIPPRRPFEPEMIALPGGEFWMGSPDGEVDRDPDEGPRHRVRIAPFAIGKTEVAFAQYDAFCQATGRAKPQDEGLGRGDRPVINVSWEDAVAYAAWLARETGEQYRLPSEAEWEYAARAGTATPFWTGQCIKTDQANYDGHHVYTGCRNKTGVYREKTVPVGSLPANPWGLHEVHGNVWEWVADPYHDSYRGAPTDGSVWGAGGRSARVVRGGSWSFEPGYLRAATRGAGEPDLRDGSQGFRLARTLSP